jgi:uncharacterized membrane protein YuzA (DUF378 family)
METVTVIALILTIIGAINWGLIGFFNWNLVAAVFGERSAISRIIYALVGLSGLYLLFVFGRLMEGFRVGV